MKVVNTQKENYLLEIHPFFSPFVDFLITFNDLLIKKNRTILTGYLKNIIPLMNDKETF